MRSATVFVLLLFAGGVLDGGLCAQTLAAQRLAHDVAHEAARRRNSAMPLPPATSVATRGQPAGQVFLPSRLHRRATGRGVLPAPRAPDLAP